MIFRFSQFKPVQNPKKEKKFLKIFLKIVNNIMSKSQVIK